MAGQTLTRSASDSSLEHFRQVGERRVSLHSRFNSLISRFRRAYPTTRTTTTATTAAPSINNRTTSSVVVTHNTSLPENRLSISELQSADAPRTQKLARRQLVLKCLEFSCDGTHQKQLVTRQQILDIARRGGGKPAPTTPPPRGSPPPPPVRPPPVSLRIEPRSKRNVRRTTRPLTLGAADLGMVKQRKRVGNSLTIRDLRQIDPDFTAKPALWVRENALVISLEEVRALVFFDRMLLFDYEKASVVDLVRYLSSFLGGISASQHVFYVPFEFRALDAILEYACYKLARDFASVRPKIQDALVALPHRITQEGLETLRQNEQELNIVYARTAKVQHAVQELLDEDEDMAGMYLTEKWRQPTRTRPQDSHEEAEALLETHLQTVDDLTTKAELLNSTIDDTEDLIEIHLDTMQNRLLLVDLLITGVTTVLAFGSMLTSIFGMNLQLPRSMRFLPSSQYYFYASVTGILLGMTVALLIITRWCRRFGRGSKNPAAERNWLRHHVNVTLPSRGGLLRKLKLKGLKLGSRKTSRSSRRSR